MGIDRIDDAILSDIEGYVLHPKVVSRAIELALEGLRPSGRQAEREHVRIEKELQKIGTEIANLTRGIGAGGDLPLLVAALRDAERRRQALEADRTNLEQLGRFTTNTGAHLEQKIQEKLADWRTTLRQEAPQSRHVLRNLIEERITFTPTPDVACWREIIRFPAESVESVPIDDCWQHKGPSRKQSGPCQTMHPQCSVPLPKPLPAPSLRCHPSAVPLN
jgi:hypothetical protein